MRAVNDRSFVRFGGLAAMLLALTSWAAVLVYAVLVDPEDPRLGLQIFRFLYALSAFWALVTVVAVYYRVRPVGEAWALFATLVGVAASIGTMVSGIHEVADLRQTPPLGAIAATDPLGVMSFGLGGLWFLLANLLLRRTTAPRILALLGLVTAAALFAAFFASLSANEGLVFLAAPFAGAISGPIYWLWLGRQLRRDS